MLDIEIAEIIETIPYAFWKSFSYQQINKRKDLKPPRWSILVNDNGVQCSLFWPGNEAPDLVTQLDNTDEAQGVDDREKTVNLTPTEAPVDINPSDSDISDLIQNVLKRHCTSLGVAALDGEEQTTQPKKIRKKSTPVKTDYTRLPTHSFLGSGNTSSGPCTPVPVGVATISNLSTPAASVASHSSPITPTVKQEPFGPNEASKRLMELSSKHFQHKNRPFWTSSDLKLIPANRESTEESPSTFRSIRDKPILLIQVTNGQKYLYGSGKRSADKKTLTLQCIRRRGRAVKFPCQSKLSVGVKPKASDLTKISSYDLNYMMMYNEHNHESECDNEISKLKYKNVVKKLGAKIPVGTLLQNVKKSLTDEGTSENVISDMFNKPKNVYSILYRMRKKERLEKTLVESSEDELKIEYIENISNNSSSDESDTF